MKTDRVRVLVWMGFLQPRPPSDREVQVPRIMF